MTVNCSWLKQLSLETTWVETYPGLKFPNMAESINASIYYDKYERSYEVEISMSDNPKTLRACVCDIPHTDLVLLRDRTPEIYMEIIKALKKELVDCENKAREIRNKFKDPGDILLFETL